MEYYNNCYKHDKVGEIFYSNFDKHHYKYFHRAQCTENAVGSSTAFCLIHTLDGAMDAGWSENAKYFFFAEKCRFSIGGY